VEELITGLLLLEHLHAKQHGGLFGKPKNVTGQWRRGVKQTMQEYCNFLTSTMLQKIGIMKKCVKHVEKENMNVANVIPAQRLM